MLFRRLEGIYGTVVIPSIGLTVGTMATWNLTRREETPPGLGEWDLHAVFSYINQYAWDANGWTKDIIVTLGNKKTGLQYRLIPTTSGRTVLEGRSLLMEGVRLEPVHAK